MKINQIKTAIQIKNLRKIYRNNKSDSFEALKGINLEIPKGSVYGLLGPNGAGKSTLINILAGLVIKTEGKVHIWNNDIDTSERNAKLAIGVVPQELIIDPFFTPRETLEYQSGFYGVPESDFIIDDLLQSVGLKEKSDAYPRSLSGGMRRRLMIAKAMVHRPPILILDEPTAGVDVELRQTLWKEIKKLNFAGVTIVLTTHYLEEAEVMCDRLAIINRGEIVAEGKTSDMISKLDKKELIVSTEKILNKKLEIDKAKIDFIGPKKLKIIFKPSEIKEGLIIEKIYDSGTKIEKISTREPDLEELFLEITKKSGT